jgi:glycine/D-amino acid oxidase-like deaminating enzyme
MAERQMAAPQRVLVVGGGIAGLATARALLRHGIEAAVVERVAAWSHPGAGMYLPANSVRALGALGVQAPVLARGQASGFVGAPALGAAMQRAGVEGHPRIEIFTSA